MRKITSFLTVLVLTMAMCGSSVYAAEHSTKNPSAEADENSITPYGSLSGYGQIWHEPSINGYGDSFSFRVSGIDWPIGHLSVKLENFNSSTKMDIEVYRGSQCIFRRQNVGINDGPWEDVSFNPATTGVYTVYYTIRSNNSAGRINCWIF